MSWLEASAVALALGYVILAIRQHIGCWLLGALSSAIYIKIFWDARLYMESGLQLLYIALSVYGFLQWQQRKQQPPLAVSRWPLTRHLGCWLLVAGATALSGHLLKTHTAAAFPYIDSLTTWAAVVTTVMVAKKVLENWLYWIAIDAVCMVVYWQRELHLTAALFALYLVLAALGYRQWRQAYRSQAN